MTRTQLEQIKKPNQIVSDFQYIEDGKDDSGFPTYKTIFIEPPKNFKLVYTDKDSKLAVLEDLDYVAQ